MHNGDFKIRGDIVSKATFQKVMKIADGKKYTNNSAIQSLVVSINEAYQKQQDALRMLKHCVKMAGNAIDVSGCYMEQGSEITKNAVAHDLATAQFSTVYLTLICVLQGEGEDIVY